MVSRPRWRWPLLGFGVGGGAVAAIALVVGIGQVAESRACAAVLSAGGAGGTSAQTATHYVLQGLPNCSYLSPPADGLYAALSPPEYGSAAQCGGYLEVSGPDGSVRVKVIDQCPGCAAGHIDLSETAFARLAPLSAGIINVTYTYLANPALPGPLTVEVKQGSSQYWLALLVDNTGNPLASVQVQTSSGWRSLARATDNYWIAASGAGSGPFTVRLTDTQGHQLPLPGITLSPGAVQSTVTLMYGAGGGQAPATPAPATSMPAAPSPTRPAPPASPAPTISPSLTPAAARTGTAPVARQRMKAAPAGPPTTSAPVPSARSSC
jgi:expansin (peptidoglycan-binding protein)